MAVLLALAAAAWPSGSRGEPVIPAGQESVLAEIFATTGGCAFDGGQVAGSSLTVAYVCPSGRVELRVRHAREAGEVHTQRFAIAVDSGIPSPGFLDALAAQVHAREAAFEWQWPMPTPKPPGWVTTLLHPRPGLDAILSRAVIVLSTATALVGLVLLGRTVLRLVRRV